MEPCSPGNLEDGTLAVGLQSWVKSFFAAGTTLDLPTLLASTLDDPVISPC